MSTDEERTNVVVGAATGMGAAVAEVLAPLGPLLLADLDADAVAATADRLGPAVRSIGCDITDEDALAAVVASAGPTRALVVTAGLSPTMAGGRRIHEVNLLALDRLVRAFEERVGPGSAAVCFASMAAHMVPPDPTIDAILHAPESPTYFDDLAAAGFDPDEPSFAYALSKRGVQLLVRRHAPAWGARGARLLSLSPGVIDTGMGQLEYENQPAMASMVDSGALARMGRPAEVAAVAAFLVSDGASFMTATDVLVDGGAVPGFHP